MDDGARPADAGAAGSRLPFLDGVRGLASGYVVLHHAGLMVAPATLGPLGLAVRFLLRHGHYAVSIFVVLSGYGLMRSVLSSPGGRPMGGMLAFLARRARRILPPYYAAICLSWLLIAALPVLARHSGTTWDRALPAFDAGVVASHLLLVHNLNARWMFAVDPPAWSLATTWQAYLFFPAFLALSRRFGARMSVALGVCIGAVVTLLAVPLGNPALTKLCPWYAALFALGMAAASGSLRANRPLETRPFALLCLLATLPLLVAATLRTGDGYLMLTDLLAGCATAALVVRWSRLSSRPSETFPPLLRLAESPGLVAVGGVSYSLYLVHFPVLALVNLGLLGHGWGGEARMAALLLVGSPLSLVVAFAFGATFERAGAWRGQHGSTTNTPRRARAGRALAR